MGSFSGPKASTDGLILSLDANNLKSTARTSTVRLLIVGGGGGGGMDMGGGGGGGQVISRQAQEIPVGVELPVVVGRGGYGGPAGGGGYRTDGVGPQPNFHQFTISATAGVASSFAGLTAEGGGYGGSSYFGYTPNNGFGGNGFNGGGASGYSDGNTGRGGTGSVALGGYNGGNASGQYYSGGGAGAGGPGVSGSSTPHGGPGVYNDITGTGYYWGGGGGGAAYSLGTGGNGGIGGGGGGAVGSTLGGTGYNNGSVGGGGSAGSQTNRPGGNAGANTGGGGGGGSHYNLNNKGGEGGSGIVVIRYPGAVKATGGNIITTVGSDTVHIFTSSGTFKLTESVSSYSTDRNILSWANWTLGSGGTGGYSQNGGTDENQRVLGTDPWGNTAVVWESRPNGNGNDDGGWNTSSFSIDKTKKYRYSVWMKRTSSTAGGTFYLGMYSNGSGARHMSDGTYNGNPYWSCSGAGAYSQNQWYLFVGHVYPHETTFTGSDPNSGLWTREGGKIGSISCNIGSGDLKWPSDATTGVHRTYHYYCGDNTTRLHFFQPRVDVCDGTEPSMDELLTNSFNTWYDASTTSSNMTAQLYPEKVLKNNVPCFYLNSVGKKFLGTLFGTQPSTNLTFEAWIYPESEIQADDRGCIMQVGGGASAYMSWNKSNLRMSNYWYGHPPEGYHESGAAVSRNTWSHFVCVWDYNTSTVKQWTNGVRTTVSPVQGNAVPGSFLQIGQEGTTRQFSGGISLLRIYNTALTDDQVLDNFNATKIRFGF